MPKELFTSWFVNYKEQAAFLNERRLVVLEGEETWAKSRIAPVLNLLDSAENCYIYGDSTIFSSNIDKKRFRDKLGSECDMIIFADSKFTIDAFAALSGTLKAGGIFILVIPHIEENPIKSVFLERFYSLIKSMSNHVVINQFQSDLPALALNEVNVDTNKLPKVHPLGCLTEEQYLAVTSIEKVVTGHRKRPLVLTADRGRGKSSALAIACAMLLRSNEHNVFSILITSPDSQALTVFFRQLKESLADAIFEPNQVSFGKANVTFMAVDQLLKQNVNANLLLVDEAAAIPVYLLESLLHRYHRMVFSSTVHGYEGAGRGFAIKFQQTLNSVCPQWHSLHIRQPIRWRENDPLEQLVFEMCLLNTELPELSELTDKKYSHLKNSVEKNKPIFNVLHSRDLVKDDVLLTKIFAVLVTAHYQTKPSDLQLLLDNPQVELACLFSPHESGSDVIAVALLMNEGANQGVGENDIDAIKLSHKRLRNHFLPQSLLSHCGVEESFNYKYLRIMRIAVHPSIQQQGIGSYLLKSIRIFAQNKGIDFIGTSFGASPSLLKFWLKGSFSIARIGFTKDKASGEHSALLLNACNDHNEKAKQLECQLQSDFYRSFDYLLLEEYKTLSTQLVKILLQQQRRQYLQPLSPQDIANVRAYSLGERQYSNCAFSLYLWFKYELLSIGNVTSHETEDPGYLILIARLIQKHDSKTVCQKYGLTGKKMLNQEIKSFISARFADNNR